MGVVKSWSSTLSYIFPSGCTKLFTWHMLNKYLHEITSEPSQAEDIVESYLLCTYQIPGPVLSTSHRFSNFTCLDYSCFWVPFPAELTPPTETLRLSPTLHSFREQLIFIENRSFIEGETGYVPKSILLPASLRFQGGLPLRSPILWVELGLYGPRDAGGQINLSVLGLGVRKSSGLADASCMLPGLYQQ